MTQTARPTIGQYTIGERIKRDDLGDVFRAYHRRQIGREVAIRLLAQDLTADPSLSQRLALGFGTLASLIHPQIVPILGHGEENGGYYLITPLIGSDSLQERLARGPLAADELLAYLWPLADALDYAHSRGITHGDLQPSHVRLDSQGNIVLADFGIARLVESSMESARSPQPAADPQGDISGLGRIAYLGLTGHEPSGSTALAAALAAWPAAAPAFRRVLATASADRYATAGEFVRELATALGATPEEQLAIEEVDQALDAADDFPPPEAAAASNPPRPKRAAPTAMTLAGILPQSAAGRRVFALWVAAIVLIGVLLGGAAIILGGRGGGKAPTVAVSAQPTVGVAQTKVAAQALAPVGDLPYLFPVNNELIARKYAEAQGHLPPDVRSTAQLHRFAAECVDPGTGGDCLLVYVFYSKRTDKMYNYHFKVLEDALIGDFLEPAANDDYRIGFNELPWVHNPNWTNLLRESFAQLPANYAPGGFSAALVSNSAALNAGATDWAMVYVERATNRQRIFELLGETITKLPE